MEINKLKKLILEKQVDEDECYDEDSDEFVGFNFKSLLREDGDEKQFEKATGLRFELLDSSRSGRGDHDTWIFRFEIDGVMYQVDGYYASHYGISLENPMDFYEVRPVEKTIIVFERV